MTDNYQYQLRPYQQEAVAAVLKEFETVDSTLVCLPTGCGKSAVACVLIDMYLKRNGGRALFLAHREELLRQAVNQIKIWTRLSAEIEQVDHFVNRLSLPQVVVASVPTMQGKRLQGFDPKTFSLVVTDEAHHCTAVSYRTIYSYLTDYQHLGITATPDRSDKKALGVIFESVAYTYDIRDAIEQGYLVPIRSQQVLVEDLDLSRVRTVAGDFVESDLEEQFLSEKALLQVADPLIRLAEQRPTLIFSPGVDHAYKLAEVLNRHKPESAKAIDGKLDSAERDKRLRDFREGRTQYLGNMGILTEGVDIPQIACVANCRPTKSRSLYCQIIGRSTRLYPGKDAALVLDFTDASQQHSLISPVDIMDGNTDPAIKARAEKLCQDGIDVLQAMALAEEQLAEEARERELARQRKLIATTRFQTVEVDPFTILGVQPRAGRWGGRPITMKQISMLEKAGLPHQNLDCGQASQVIGKLIDRRERGLCTLKMGRVLARYGLSPDVPFEVARQQMSLLASSRYNVTNELRQRLISIKE